MNFVFKKYTDKESIEGIHYYDKQLRKIDFKTWEDLRKNISYFQLKQSEFKNFKIISTWEGLIRGNPFLEDLLIFNTKIIDTSKNDTIYEVKIDSEEETIFVHNSLELKMAEMLSLNHEIKFDFRDL